MNIHPGIYVCCESQCLHLTNAEGGMDRAYPISTSRYGLGESNGSRKTPRGWHRLYKKIGHDCAENIFFKARVPIGAYTFKQARLREDWILARILWLSGHEPGKNLHGDVDTQQRFIYIHGAPSDEVIGGPKSQGCIRMRCHDIVDLFECVYEGMLIFIGESRKVLESQMHRKILSGEGNV